MPFSSLAQVQQAWVARYNNGMPAGTNQAVKMALDTNGNIYLTGFSQNTNGNLDYATLKYAPNGNQLWAARYVATNTTTAQPSGLALDPQGNVFVTGTGETVKYDNNGNQLWIAPYTGAALAGDTNGNLYVTGVNSNFTTVKISPSGSNLWQQTYTDIGPALGQAVAVDAAGEVYVAGPDTYYYAYPTIHLDPFARVKVIKYDANGNQLWISSPMQTYDGVQVYADALDGSGNFYVGYNAGGGSGEYVTTKYGSSNGSILWSAQHPYEDPAILGFGLALDGSNDVFVTGEDTHFHYPNATYASYMIDTNGNYVWTNFYPQIPATATNAGTTITVDHANNVYVTGYSQGANSGLDIVTIAYSNNGNQLWLQRYNGPGNGDDEGNAIAVDAIGNVYVAGYETTSAGGTEMVLIKYAPGPLVKKQSNGYMLLQAVGAANQNFDFQASTNLQLWQDLGIVPANSNGLAQYLDTNAPQYNARFYQANPQ